MLAATSTKSVRVYAGPRVGLRAMDYVIVIEQANDGSYSAYVPDLHGCVACGDTQVEARKLIGEAVALHIKSLRAHREVVPAPTSIVDVVHAA